MANASAPKNSRALAPLGVIAGEGSLPLVVVENALQQGYPVWVYAVDGGNLGALKSMLPPTRIRRIQPGLLERNFTLLRNDGIQAVVMAGKVNKWTLLKSPVLDKRALSLWHTQRQFNDDAIMLRLIEVVEAETGVKVLPQVDFMTSLFLAPGEYSQRSLTRQENEDVTYGLALAREMGRLDIGQTVVVCNGMVLAVEAIEGTDKAIRRAGQWKKGIGGVVAKVEKPNQDTRFDVPAVGPRTLKAMKKARLSVLAIEAHKTLVLDLPEVQRLANRWQMSLVVR